MNDRMGFWRWLYKVFPSKAKREIGNVARDFFTSEFLEAMVGFFMVLFGLVHGIAPFLSYWILLLPLGIFMMLHAGYRADRDC